MAPTAYIAITTEPCAREDVLKSLREIPGVKKAAAVYGEKDIIASVYEPTMDKLNDTITWRVRRIDKVRTITAHLVVEDDSAFSRNEKGEIEKFKL
jgi:DNA-binding Lrp family transcriptional regulator